MMKLTGAFTFQRDQETVWGLLMDTNAIARALPGVDALVPLDNEADAWRANVKISVAALSGSYSAIMRMSDRQAPRQYRMSVNGEGQQSIINGSALISLAFDPQTGTTLVTWEADAGISGKLARVGQRLISAAATMLANRFFEALAAQLPEA